jgi:hypothetical protein
VAKLMVSPADTARLLVDAGFVGWQVVRMGSIAMAESGLDAYGLGVNHKPGQPDHLSIDCGLLMLSNYWWLPSRGLVIRDVLDPGMNCREGFAIFAQRGGLRNPVDGYRAWSAYTNGAYVRWQGQAIDAARTVGAFP